MLLPRLLPGQFTPDRFTRRQRLFPDRQAPLVVRGGHPLRLALPLVLTASDLSGFDGLILAATNLTDAPISAGLRLVHASGAVSFTGGREVLAPGVLREILFPMDGFGSYGRPEGFCRVTCVELILRREKDQNEPARLAASVTGLCAVRRAPLEGPRLTRAGLESVLTDPGQALSGRKLFLSLPASPPPAVFPYPLEGRARTLAGWIMGQKTGLPPDWTADPLGQLEWRHFLHRHHFLRTLARGRPVRAREIVGAITDWIRGNPVPVDSDGGAGPAFETLCAALRMREWLILLPAVWNTPECGPAAREAILASIWEQARHLRDHRGHPGNWRLLEAAALATCGLYFPEFAEAGEWTGLGLARLEAEAASQFLAGGMHTEGSPLYHALCLEACLTVLRAAELAGYRVSQAFRDRLRLAASALAWLSRPDRVWPSVNDAASTGGDYRPHLTLARQVLGPLPGRPAAVLLDEAGLAVLRGERTWVLFKAGPRPPSHGHGDDLSLEIFLDGRAVVLDPGITGYAPTALNLAYREAPAHSCPVLPDDFPRAGKIGLIRSRGLLGARAERSQGQARVIREVYLPGPGIVAVRDLFQDGFPGPARVHWQFGPGPLRLDRRTGRASGLRWRLILLPGATAFSVVRRQGQTAPPAGFVSIAGKDVPAPRLEFVFPEPATLELWWIFLGSGRVRRTPGGVRFSLEDGCILDLDAGTRRVTSLRPGRTRRKRRP